ncbi:MULTISPECIES: hypothetical protein [Streptococcus]|uniref:hypothetical protein n=1 Tax=Streptococcus TaxID=1301 RepID=UPI0012DDAA07|nr:MULTISPECIES: hypothetical protein [Streptococcus]QHF55122.1 hypothetical protein BZG42_07140 [Streptococcus sp. DAT741]
MKNYKNSALLGVPITMIILGVATPNSNPWWIKPLILTITIILQLILLSILFRIQPNQRQQAYFGLTEKLYTCTLLTTMGIYTKGIWVITPDTNPAWLKHLFLGLSLLILVGFFLYFAIKKVDEKADDRFYINLAKAASLTLILVLSSLMVLSIITFFMPFSLNAGMVLIYGATMIFIFDIGFWIFEKRGG